MADGEMPLPTEVSATAGLDSAPLPQLQQLGSEFTIRPAELLQLQQNRLLQPADDVIYY